MKSDLSVCRISGLMLLAAGATFKPAIADSILFPVLVSNPPDVTTLFSVVDGAASGGSTHLTYIYRYKDAFDSSGVPNRNGNCSSRTLTRSTTNGDVVSFDVSGSFDGGGALFGDANFYGGDFGLGVSGPQRGYLLVTNSNSSGTPVAVGDNVDLSGEFVAMDIVGGAAWGGKAINDINREDFDFINATTPGGGVYSALPSNGSVYRRFTFAPPNEWSTRFFVTPIGANMDSAQLSAPISIVQLYDRDGQARPFTSIVLTVTCTAAVDLQDLVDSSTWAAVENVGGWAYLGAVNAVVHKLEYSMAPQYNGTVNNGFLLSDYALP